METNYISWSDDQLVLSYHKNGNDKALTALIERYEKPLRNMCYSFVHNIDDANDLLQETWLRAIEAILRGNYGYRNSFGGWMRRIITNTYINWYRAAKFKSSIMMIQDDSFIQLIPARDNRTPESIYIGKEFRSSFKEFLKTKYQKPGYGKTMELFLDGYKYREIASMGNITLGAVKTRIHRITSHAKNDPILKQAM